MKYPVHTYVIFVVCLLFLEAAISESGDPLLNESAKRTYDPGNLEINTTNLNVSGIFSRDNQTIAFDSTELPKNVFNITLEINGITLAALVDQWNNVAILDGYSTDTARNSYISQSDRAMLLAFNDALFESASDLNPASEQLQHVVSIWSEYPITLDLTNVVVGQEMLGIKSLCQHMGKPIPATHDDRKYDAGSDESTLDMAYVSPPSFGECPGDDKTWFHNGTWTCFEPDHDPNIEKARGNCFGNCGAGCSGGGLQMTMDCHNHDQCVRNGHSIASVSCLNEFKAAMDDELNASDCTQPNIHPTLDDSSQHPEALAPVTSSQSSTRPGWKLNKLEYIISMLENKSDRTATEVQQAQSTSHADSSRKLEIALIRQQIVMRHIVAQSRELYEKVDSGDKPDSLTIGTKQERHQVAQRLGEITHELDALSQRLQSIRHDERRIEETILELKQAQKEAQL